MHYCTHRFQRCALNHSATLPIYFKLESLATSRTSVLRGSGRIGILPTNSAQTLFVPLSHPSNRKDRSTGTLFYKPNTENWLLKFLKSKISVLLRRSFISEILMRIHFVKKSYSLLSWRVSHEQSINIRTSLFHSKWICNKQVGRCMIGCLHLFSMGINLLEC